MSDSIGVEKRREAKERRQYQIHCRDTVSLCGCLFIVVNLPEFHLEATSDHTHKTAFTPYKSYQGVQLIDRDIFFDTTFVCVLFFTMVHQVVAELL